MNTQLQKFLDGLTEIVNDGNEEGSITMKKVDVIEGQKFIKVVTAYENDDQHRSVYAFIAKYEGFTKALGEYKQGDVLKPASWKTPAKHARGNIFDDDNGLGSAGKYGLEYLR